MKTTLRPVRRLALVAGVAVWFVYALPVEGQEGFSSPPAFQRYLNDTRDGIGPCVPGHPRYEPNCVDPDGDGPLEWADGHQWTGNQHGIAFDSQGNYFIVDNGHRQVRKFNGQDQMVLKWNVSGGNWNDAIDVAVDSEDNVWVSTRRDGVIRKYDADGTPLAGSIVVGTRINGIHIDGQDRIFVVLDGPADGEVRRYDDGVFTLRVYPIRYPSDIATDSVGNIWVTAAEGPVSPWYSLTKFSPSGARLQLFAVDNIPAGIVIDDNNRLYLSNVNRDDSVTVFDSDLNELYAFGPPATEPGYLGGPAELAFSTDGGSLYVNDRSTTGFLVFAAPETVLEGLIEEIEGLADDAVLNGGQANALIVKVEGVLDALASGATTAALNRLFALRNQIEALMLSGVLTAEQGQPLLDAIDAVFEALQG